MKKHFTVLACLFFGIAIYPELAISCKEPELAISIKEPELAISCKEEEKEKKDEVRLIRIGHPRLMLDDAELAVLKSKIKSKDNEVLTKIHNICIKYADNALTASPLKYQKDASNTRILTISRDAVLRIFCEAYAYRVTGDSKYLERAETDLHAVCSFPDWNPSHYLDVAEMATAVAIGYDWLYHSLKPETRELLLDRLNRYAMDTSFNETDATFYTSIQNWNQVCNSGLVFAALATFESNPNLSRTIINKAVSSNPQVQKASYSPDGNYAEGLSYWAYGTTYEVLMIDNMKTCLGRDFGLSSIEGFMKTPQYILFGSGTSGKRFNYSDNGIWDAPQAPMWYFAAELNDPSILYEELKKIENGKYLSSNDRFMPMMALYASKLDLNNISNPDELAYSGKGATPVAIVRTGWFDTNVNKYLGIKGGKASTNHSHMDAGSFVYDAYGIRWAMDLGPEIYTQAENGLSAMGKNFWSLKQESYRWKLFRYNNKQHNTITINDKDFLVDGSASLLETYTSGDRLGAKFDLTPVYGDEMEQVQRTAVICNDEYLEITDYLKTPSDRPASIRWTMVTDCEPQITTNGIVLTKKGLSVIVKASGMTEPPVQSAVEEGRKSKRKSNPKIKYKIWSADPRNYTSPLKDIDSANPDVWIIGWETSLDAGTENTFTTTIEYYEVL